VRVPSSCGLIERLSATHALKAANVILTGEGDTTPHAIEYAHTAKHAANQ